VNQDLTVKVLMATDMGTNLGAFLPILFLFSPSIEARREGNDDGWRLMREIDYAAVNAVVDATHRYKEIFYTE
jgi:hypothetical protein